jgi:5-methyltetrahydrofolate--homocysteine methyltransferase
MSDSFRHLLDSRPCLIADGGMGTSLFAAGLETGGSPELWNIDHPDRVQAIHRGFIDAGADIILSNTFGGTRYRLKLHQLDHRVDELNLAATRVARAAADDAGRPVIVAGDMGPTGELFEPLGVLTRPLGIEAFAEQARALAEGGADILWIETMSSREEVEAAVLGAGVTGLPIVCTLTFDTAGRTMMGMTPEDAAEFCQGLGVTPVAFGANCGNGPAELVNAMTRLASAARSDAVLVAKSNCGIPEYIDGQVRYNGTPEIMGRYARMARDAGARIIGGCCGSTPEHLRAIVAALDGYTPGEMPDVAAIEDRLGPLAAAAKPGGAKPPRPRARAGRRRGA